jgi:hypothetical protein
MGETANQIAWEIAQKRTELSDNLIELKQRAKATVDWRWQVEKRPGTMLAVAFGGGMILSQRCSARYEDRRRFMRNRLRAVPASTTVRPLELRPNLPASWPLPLEKI